MQLLDVWHPLEKAQYPDYFARRHQRKLEYIERYEKKYGKLDKEKKKLEEKYGPFDPYAPWLPHPDLLAWTYWRCRNIYVTHADT